MSQILSANKMERCIGCDLCALACSRSQNRTLSLEDSCIKIRREGKRFFAEIDHGRCQGCGVCVHICPRECLSLEEGRD